MADDYRKGVRLILLINVPAAAGLALLSEPIVRVLFQHGRFDSGDTHAMVPLLALFAVGMPFFSVVSLTTRAFYATKDTATPVKIATVSFVINVSLSWILKNVMGALGLVLASTVAIVVQTVLMQALLARRLPGMSFGDVWRTLGKVAVGTGLMGAFVWGGWVGLHASIGAGRTTDLAAIFLLIPMGAGLYAVVLWILRVEGRDEFKVLIDRFRGKHARR